MQLCERTQYKHAGGKQSEQPRCLFHCNTVYSINMSSEARNGLRAFLGGLYLHGNMLAPVCLSASETVVREMIVTSTLATEVKLFHDIVAG